MRWFYLDVISANTIGRDTFIVTRMMPISNSNILVVIEETIGLYFLNMTTLSDMNTRQIR
jgi:hypothetical protein